MFSNLGVKIKVISKIMFWVAVIVCIILAFVLGVEVKNYVATQFYPEVFWPLFVGGPIGAYLSSLLMYAIGELVENSQLIFSLLRALKKDLNERK